MRWRFRGVFVAWRGLAQAGGGVVVVTHGAVCSMIIKTLTGKGFGQQKRKAGQVRHTGCTELVQRKEGEVR